MTTVKLLVAGCILVSLHGCMVESFSYGPYSQSRVTLGEGIGLWVMTNTAPTSIMPDKTTFFCGVRFGFWAPLGSYTVAAPIDAAILRQEGGENFPSSLIASPPSPDVASLSPAEDVAPTTAPTPVPTDVASTAEDGFSPRGEGVEEGALTPIVAVGDIGELPQAQQTAWRSAMRQQVKRLRGDAQFASGAPQVLPLRVQPVGSHALKLEVGSYLRKQLRRRDVYYVYFDDRGNSKVTYDKYGFD